MVPSTAGRGAGRQRKLHRTRRRHSRQSDARRVNRPLSDPTARRRARPSPSVTAEWPKVSAARGSFGYPYRRERRPALTRRRRFRRARLGRREQAALPRRCESASACPGSAPRVRQQQPVLVRVRLLRGRLSLPVAGGCRTSSSAFGTASGRAAAAPRRGSASLCSLVPFAAPVTGATGQSKVGGG
jgi:hypothetical protein